MSIYLFNIIKNVQRNANLDNQSSLQGIFSVLNIFLPMELERAKQTFSYLQSAGISIGVFISDRHRGIAKWIWECQTGCAHYFDIWHVERSIIYIFKGRQVLMKNA